MAAVVYEMIFISVQNSGKKRLCTIFLPTFKCFNFAINSDNSLFQSRVPPTSTWANRVLVFVALSLANAASSHEISTQDIRL